MKGQLKKLLENIHQLVDRISSKSFKLFSQENSISQKESLRLLKIWSVKMTSIQKSCVNLSLFLRLSL